MSKPSSVSVLTPNSQLLNSLRARLEKSLQGKDELIEKSLACFLAGGHLLLQGPPGTGKTSLAKGMAHAFGGSFNRIQMTSDLLPSDVVGILRIKPGAHEFEFRPGPVFANFVLADEINRTTPKTQSALLEAMEEDTVSVDGKTYELPKPFFVVATQNPLEFHGVYPFAESQLDRFMMQLNFSAPDENNEFQIYNSPEHGHALALTNAAPSLSPGQALQLRAEVAAVHAEESVVRYLTQLVRQTREIPGINHGVSVRGGIQFLQACRALAWLRERNFVTPREVRDLATACLSHRLFFNQMDLATGQRETFVQEILDRVPAPQ